MGKLVFFDIVHQLLVDFDLCAPTRIVFFQIDHILLVDFDLCAPTRLIFRYCSVTVGGILLVRFQGL